MPGPSVKRVGAQRSSRGRVVISREDRIKTRRDLGDLRGLLITEALKKRYERALQRFFVFEDSGTSFYSRSTLDLDEGVAAFIECLWHEGEPRYWGEDVISGLTKFVPGLKGCFNLSWSLITAWQKNELPQRCVPLDVRTFKAYCGVALHLGEPEFALLLALGYHGLLRTAEMYNINIGDMEMDIGGSTGVLTLPHSKSGTRYNIVESVVIDDCSILARWRELTAGRMPGDSIYVGGARGFRKLFDKITNMLKLPSGLLYKPYSIRRGAATTFFRIFGSMSKTCVRGRWNNERSCRIYINEAVQTMANIRFSGACTEELEHWSTSAETWFSREDYSRYSTRVVFKRGRSALHDL